MLPRRNSFLKVQWPSWYMDHDHPGALPAWPFNDEILRHMLMRMCAHGMPQSGAAALALPTWLLPSRPPPPPIFLPKVVIPSSFLIKNLLGRTVWMEDGGWTK